MPNSIDFQVGSKFMELAGGVEVNNLQEAIKKALQEITLPDLPSSSPNASSSSSDLPRLAPPTAGGLSLETLAQMISNETRTQATKDGVASIDAKGKERAEINEKKLEEIMGSPRLHEIQRYPRCLQKDFQLGRRDRRGDSQRRHNRGRGGNREPAAYRGRGRNAHYVHQQCREYGDRRQGKHQRRDCRRIEGVRGSGRHRRVCRAWPASLRSPSWASG